MTALKKVVLKVLMAAFLKKHMTLVITALEKRQDVSSSSPGQRKEAVEVEVYVQLS